MALDESDGLAAHRFVPRVVLAHEPATRLGPLSIVPALRQIVHADGREEIVEPKVMEVLVALLKAGGAILTRSELCDAAWDGRIVGDDAINRVLARLRRLSEGLGAGVFHVETITKVGYRLVRQAGAIPVSAATRAAASQAPDRAAAAAAPVAPVPTASDAAAAASSGQVRHPRRGLDRRLLLGGGVALAAAAGVGGWRVWRGGAAVADSVAVLPFANLSGDVAQAYFSDGIAEELRSALARIVRLKVAARTSSELMRNADATVAAAKLGVATILAGSVRRGTGTVRVSAQLIDGSTGLALWSDSFDRPAGDALQVQSGIATSVAHSLNIALGRAETALLSAGGTTDPAAHDAYLRGSALAAEQNNAAARDAFADAIAADPRYALAHAGLAGVIALLANEGSAAVRSTLAAAEVEARRAVALAPGLGAPLAVLGFVLMSRLKLPEAEQAHRDAYRLAPGDAYVLSYYALFQAYMGRGSVAIAVARRAFALDPLRPNGLRRLGVILARAGRLDDAILTLRRGLVRLPGDLGTRSSLSFALLAAGRPQEAAAVVATMPVDTWQYATNRAIAAAKLGDRAASDRALRQLEQIANAAYQIAEVHAQRGDPDAAFAALDRAVAAADSGLLNLKVDPLLAPLHSDPRYDALLRSIGFPVD